jgi:hypothetical protein
MARARCREVTLSPGDSPPSVGDREADIDRRDHGESDRIDIAGSSDQNPSGDAAWIAPRRLPR